MLATVEATGAALTGRFGAAARALRNRELRASVKVLLKVRQEPRKCVSACLGLQEDPDVNRRELEAERLTYVKVDRISNPLIVIDLTRDRPKPEWLFREKQAGH